MEHADIAIPPSRRILQTIRAAYEDQVFRPRWWSVFCNAFYLSRRGIFEGILRHAPKLSGRLMDFGCGSKPYRDLFRVDEYVGVDIQVSGHASVDKHADVFYDGKTLPFSDRCFDSMLASEVLEHVFNLDAILAEMYRVLKPGGVLLITIPFAWDQHEVPYDFARYTEWGIKCLLERHGFAVETQEKTSTHIETVAQLIVSYFYKYLPDNAVFKAFRVFSIAPVFLVGLLLSRILPKGNGFFLNQVIVARRN
jgi:SAM-dependent methyltransferase